MENTIETVSAINIGYMFSSGGRGGGGAVGTGEGQACRCDSI